MIVFKRVRSRRHNGFVALDDDDDERKATVHREYSPPRKRKAVELMVEQRDISIDVI